MTSFDINPSMSDEEFIIACNQRRLSLTRPSQSLFRVYTIFIVDTETGVQIIEGANCEQGFIGGAICAERVTLK